jgi:hypothetical protein
VRLLEKDSFRRAQVNSEDLEDDELESWNENSKQAALYLLALEPIVNDPAHKIFGNHQERRGLISTAAAVAGVDRSTIYALLVKYWTGGQTPQCLFPDYRPCGGTSRKCDGGKKRGLPSALDIELGYKLRPALTETTKAQLLAGRDMFYRGETTLKRAYDLTVGKYFSDGPFKVNGVPTMVAKPDHEVPDLRSFMYVHHLSRDPQQETENRQGKKFFKLNVRGLHHRTETELMAPGQLAQMDATTADIYLVDEKDRSKLVGRPIVYGIKDAWGKFLYSIIATFEHPSYWAGAMALEIALTDKVQYCADYGIPIGPDDWPVNFLPAMMRVDRGELSTFKSDQMIQALGIGFETLPFGRGDLKAIIERHFGLLNSQVVKWLPGALPRFEGDVKKRHELDGCLTINEFRFFLLQATLAYHKRLLTDHNLDEDMLVAEVRKTPISLLRWALDNRNGKFHDFDLNVARLQLLPAEKATVTKSGILFRTLYYTCEHAVAEKWFDRARLNGRYKVAIGYDPRSVGRIFLRDAKNSTTEACSLMSGSNGFRNFTWEELTEYRKDEAIQKAEDAGQETQETLELDAMMNHVKTQAVAKRDAAVEQAAQSPTRRVKNISADRENAKTQERADSLNQNDDSQDSPNDGTAASDADPGPQPPPTVPQPATQFMKLLTASRNKAQEKNEAKRANI